MNDKMIITAESLDSHYSSKDSFIPVISSSTNVITQPEFNKLDYYNSRPSQSIPGDMNGIMQQCEDIYWKTGALRSIVEFISEFIVDGLEIIHENPEIQKFYRTWMRKCDLVNRAEQFARHLYRSGNVVIRRYTAEISVPEKNKMIDGVLLANYNKYPSKKRNSIPIKYVFYRPSAVRLVGDELGAWSENKIYGIQVSSKDIARLQHGRTELEKKVWESLPPEIKESIKKTSQYITYPLPSDKIYVGHYKKDDSDPWAYPLIYSSIQTLLYNQNLLMAKSAALEGWYNLIRIWKLGDHKEGILPPKNAADKLLSILSNNTGGGKMDLIWDSMLTMEEHYPPVEKLAALQEDKYAILLLFGIPEELAGGVMDKAGSGSSSIRLKNFAKKLDGGRREVSKWILGEIDIVHRNMGFDKKPFIRFNNDDLMDEGVYYQLLRELVDRNILSSQTILERMSEVPEIEEARIKDQQSKIKNKELPQQASPFHNPNLLIQHELDMEKTKFELKNVSNEVNKKVDSKKNGRPIGVKDRAPRKRSGNKINKAEMMSYASNLYEYIDKEITKSFLKNYSIDNARQLTNEQKSKLDTMKNILFSNTSPGTPINSDLFKLDKPDSELYELFSDNFINLLKNNPLEQISRDQKNMYKVSAYTDMWDIDE